MENKEKIKFIDNKNYQICSGFIRSIAAFIDFFLIFLIFLIISLFFKSYIFHLIDLKINTLINNNINVSDVNMYSNDIGVSDLLSGIKQSFGIFVSEFKFLFYILILMYFSFWGMIISFLFIGKTPGSKIFKLKLFDIDVRTREADLTQRVIRVIIYLADFFFIFGLGTLYSIFNKDKRGLAEIVSGTIALRRK